MGFANCTEVDKAYFAKYKIQISSNWNNDCVLEKKSGKITLYMLTGLHLDKCWEMMQTSLDMGTNYLEDYLIKSGLRWHLTDPDEIPDSDFEWDAQYDDIFV